MKLAFSIAVFAMLQPCALSSILRGSAGRKLDTYHRRAQSKNGRTGQATGNDWDNDQDDDNDWDNDEEYTEGVGGLQLEDGCPEDHHENLNFQPCTGYADCAGPCAGADGCCCVNSAKPYCGFPAACNDWLTCVDDRSGGLGGNGVIDGVTTDQFGCIVLSQEWCPFRNSCVAIGGCVNNPADNLECEPGEFFCAIRDDCILSNSMSCPDTNPNPGCIDKRLTVGTITEQTTGTTFAVEALHVTYDNPTIVRGSSSSIGNFYFTLLHQEWKMTLGGPTCVDNAAIHVYLTQNLRNVVHVCYDAGITQSSTNTDVSTIPACGGPVPASGYYRMELIAS